MEVSLREEIVCVCVHVCVCVGVYLSFSLPYSLSLSLSLGNPLRCTERRAGVAARRVGCGALPLGASAHLAARCTTARQTATYSALQVPPEPSGAATEDGGGAASTSARYCVRRTATTHVYNVAVWMRPARVTSTWFGCNYLPGIGRSLIHCYLDINSSFLCLEHGLPQQPGWARRPSATQLNVSHTR